MRCCVIVVVIMMSCFPLDAVSKEPIRGFQFHGGAIPEKTVDPSTGEIGLAKVIKGVKLPHYPLKTFGEATDSYQYFSKKVWKETRSTNGKVYVDFTGWLKQTSPNFSDVAMRGVGIKILVTPDGSYAIVMVSKVETKTDGKIYSVPQSNKDDILNKLYKNIEIKF